MKTYHEEVVRLNVLSLSRTASVHIASTAGFSQRIITSEVVWLTVLSLSGTASFLIFKNFSQKIHTGSLPPGSPSKKNGTSSRIRKENAVKFFVLI